MVLITGGAGYIGSILTPHLLQAGYQVTVLDNLMYQQKSLLDCFAYPNFRFVKGEATDKSLLKKLLATNEFVIPLAAIVGAPACTADAMLAKKVNEEALDILLDSLGEHHKVLYPNTNSGYGIGKENVPCTEESPLNPLSLYGRQKVEGEKKVLSTGKGISFRLATVFGVSPRMRLDLLVNHFTYKAATEGTLVLFEEHFKRNFVHVFDVARAFLFGIKNYTKMKDQVYNLGDTRANASKKELCEMIKEHVPHLYIVSAPFENDPDKRDYIVSNEKVEKLGWRPEKTLNQGILELLQAFSILKQNPYANI